MENRLKSTLVIGVSIIITALILGTAFKNRNENLDTISVVGLGTTDFVSDEILWSGSFATKSFDIKEAYNKMISDQKIVSDFFLSKGFKKEEFTFGAVQFNKRFREVRIENPENVYQTKYASFNSGNFSNSIVVFLPNFSHNSSQICGA